MDLKINIMLKMKHLQLRGTVGAVLFVLLLGVVGMTEVMGQTGALSGVFSINKGTQINFSQGNLQYQASTNTWRFAENQWDYVGDDNANISESYDGWIDLFGWGTSGYDHGATCYEPWSTSKSYWDYYVYGSETYNLFDQTGQADWGYNAISNGGNQENSGWRTLTFEEWSYLLRKRQTLSGIRYAGAQLNGINGVILLPDDWDPDYFTLNNPNGINWESTYESNVITDTQWEELEKHGAVFMPAAGDRKGIRINNINEGGAWWSSTASSSVYFFGDAFVFDSDFFRHYGLSVRLVRQAQSYSFAIGTATNPVEGGMVSGAGVYGVETECTLVATPNEGYVFVGWTENGEVVSTKAEYSFTVTGGGNIVANFRYADADITDGAFTGQFSVGEGKQVFFSQGNLQYIGSSDVPQWKFAEHQWDYMGDNGQSSDDRKANRDLFCWSSSGYEHGGENCQPWQVNGIGYYAYGLENGHLFDRTGKADWGYHAIANGGNKENGGWRTLSYEEWDYLINTRNTRSGIRYAKATLNDVYGIILLPDDWDVSYYTLNGTNEADADYDANIITVSQWNGLEKHGAVFLPAAGFLVNGNYVHNWHVYGYEDEVYGCYWTSSADDYNPVAAWGFGFSNCEGDGLFIDDLHREQANPVRLVRSNVSFNINAASNDTLYGVVGGSRVYFEDTRATVTAVAHEGYDFLHWTEDEEVVSDENAYSFTVNGNRNLVAVFTHAGAAPIGAINGMFTLSDGQRAYFSQGNLQYIGTAGNGDENNTGAYWKFADHQWDILGDNGQGDSLLVMDRDLFGWGTSGYDHGALNYQPWKAALSTGHHADNYDAYGCDMCNLFDESGMADWGFNAIANGGNTENCGWHTPTREEWNYVLFLRSTVSEIRFAKAQVNEVNGLILLPDNWSRSYYALNQTNKTVSEYNSNIITLEQWSVLEQHGAVFLPAAGNRFGVQVLDINDSGNYWSSTACNVITAYGLSFEGGSYQTSANGYHRRGTGESVRLARPIHTYAISAVPVSSDEGGAMGTGIYFEGATCTVTAIPNEDYIFVNWTENSEVVSTDPVYSFTVTGDRELVAHFSGSGVEETEAMLRVWPNPVRAHGELRLELPAGEKVLVEIYNPLGVKVMSKETADGRVVLNPSVAPGTYIMKVVSAMGSGYHCKLIVE